MSNQVTNQPDHDKIVSLLPWFVNQTLEEHQRQAVLGHIEHCDECQREIQFLASLNDTVQSDVQNHYTMHADVDRDLASVMNRIDAKRHPVNALASGASFLQQNLGKVFNFATALTVPQWSATALAGVLVAVLGFQLYYDPSDNDYSVLSASDTNDSSMRLSVETTSAVNQEQVLAIIQHELEKNGQQAEIETKKDGLYSITFGDSIGVSELSKLVVGLENQAQIKHVEMLP